VFRGLPGKLNRDGKRRDQALMGKLFAELLFGLIRILIVDLIGQAAFRVCAWLDSKISGRRTRIAVGLFLGIALYFLLPIVLGLLGL
jgi:hypothetical protein